MKWGTKVIEERDTRFLNKDFFTTLALFSLNIVSFCVGVWLCSFILLDLSFDSRRASSSCDAASLDVIDSFSFVFFCLSATATATNQTTKQKRIDVYFPLLLIRPCNDLKEKRRAKLVIGWSKLPSWFFTLHHNITTVLYCQQYKNWIFNQMKNKILYRFLFFINKLA